MTLGIQTTTGSTGCAVDNAAIGHFNASGCGTAENCAATAGNGCAHKPRAKGFKVDVIFQKNKAAVGRCLCAGILRHGTVVDGKSAVQRFVHGYGVQTYIHSATALTRLGENAAAAYGVDHGHIAIDHEQPDVFFRLCQGVSAQVQNDAHIGFYIHGLVLGIILSQIIVTADRVDSVVGIPKGPVNLAELCFAATGADLRGGGGGDFCAGSCHRGGSDHHAS